MRKRIFSPDAPRNPTLYGNHSPNGPPVGAAYMPPAHPARITNFPHLLRRRGRACPALRLAYTTQFPLKCPS